MLYTGQQFDDATGLYYLRARYYNPDVGRFLSRDSVYPDQKDTGQLHRYGYGANNPINGMDPSGHMFFEYAAGSKDAEEQAAERARYVNGYTLATGANLQALEIQSILSAVVDESIILAIGVYIDPRQVTVGLGTIYHLQSSTQTKVFAATKNNWGSIASTVGGQSGPLSFPSEKGTGGLVSWLLAFTANLESPTLGVVVLLRFDHQGGDEIFSDWFDLTMRNHAEMIIAQWALEHFGGYPTPHRVLDIATTIGACGFKKNGGAACRLRLPELREVQPLLFQTTIFPNL